MSEYAEDSAVDDLSRSEPIRVLRMGGYLIPVHVLKQYWGDEAVEAEWRRQGGE